MYVVTPDVGVTITNVVLDSDSEAVTPQEPEQPTAVTLAVGDVINFETATSVNSFGGTEGSLLSVDDNTVLNVVKGEGSETWAGVAIATGNYVYPLTSSDTVMSASVYSDSPAVIRMK